MGLRSIWWSFTGKRGTPSRMTEIGVADDDGVSQPVVYVYGEAWGMDVDALVDAQNAIVDGNPAKARSIFGRFVNRD